MALTFLITGGFLILAVQDYRTRDTVQVAVILTTLFQLGVFAMLLAWDDIVAYFRGDTGPSPLGDPMLSDASEMLLLRHHALSLDILDPDELEELEDEIEYIHNRIYDVKEYLEESINPEGETNNVR
jgi:hypothetical protein